MKKILNIIALSALLMLGATGCKEKDPFTTANENDTPRFLAPDNITDFVESEQSFFRSEPFEMDVVVTPADYVDIQWISEGEVLETGTSISRTFKAGDYQLLVLATTKAVMPKSTYRIINLNVRAEEGDPTVDQAEKNLWLNPGKSFTMKGENLSNVEKVILTPYIELDMDELRGVSKLSGERTSVTVKVDSASEDEIQFQVPETMERCIHRIELACKGGDTFGCGKANVTDEEYKEPGTVKLVLWEGEQAINWGDANINLTAEQLQDVPVGTAIKVAYTTPEADYHAMRITTPQWGDLPEDDAVRQFDITADTPQPFEFIYDQRIKELAEARGGLLFVGFGYTISEIYYEGKGGTAEYTLWEGEQEINWGDSNVTLTPEMFSDVKPGTKIKVYFDMPEAEYHAMRITTPQWGDLPEDDVVCQFDLTPDTPQPFEFTFDQRIKALIDDRGGMLFVGFGYTLKKVTFEGAAAAETELWSGECQVNWGETNVNVTAEAMSQVEAGKTICIYYDVPEAEYHAMRITTPQWGDLAEDDMVCQFDITSDTPQPFEFKYTAACKALSDARGGMLCVGFGYTITRITFK